MVAKINRGASLYGAVIYNQQKVDDSTRIRKSPYCIYPLILLWTTN